MRLLHTVIALLCGLGLSGCATVQFFLDHPKGLWERRDAQTLAFSGIIWPGSDLDFEAAVTPQTRTLILDSGGGETGAAIRIAQGIRERGLDVVVTGRCASSCANYLFAAGARRTIRDGVVAFHGGSLSLNTDPARVSAEAELYARLHIDLELLRLPGELSAGNDTLWVPDLRELACLGVGGVTAYAGYPAIPVDQRATLLVTAALAPTYQAQFKSRCGQVQL
jgi:hypothetical protein